MRKKYIIIYNRNIKYISLYLFDNHRFTGLYLQTSGHLFVCDDTKNHPVYGEAALTLLVQFFDDSKAAAHQGPQPVIDRFEKEKIVGFSDDGTEVDLNSFVETNLRSCKDCRHVSELKARGKQRGKLTWISEEDVPSVLSYGDKHHTGYHGVHQVLGSWCDFQDYEKKVGLISIEMVLFNFLI